MYLKRVEFIGFKSFADKTVMNFLPGMTAIVGPNGCGKSNIADAIRWVLGEQSAKALRGGKMMDVIFNGADGVKPTNYAEVGLTLADCEGTLKTDYHEVTITRRLFRDGASEYYLNKQGCRLKDIHRLFMDTGMGRSSYSILEQGKIDQILSSHPEDRRIVFEEASGITKYKSDRAEALRKLESTEQNLVRLDDVIREVKRRMISLQRQAAKARRYQEIQIKLRAEDLWLTRHRLDEMREALGELEVHHDQLRRATEASRTDIETREDAIASARADLEAADKAIADQMEAAVSLRNDLNQARQSVKVNRERIEEMKTYASRDSRDAEEARARLEQHHQAITEGETSLSEARVLRDEAEAGWQQRQSELRDLESAGQDQRRLLQEKRARISAVENTLNRAQGLLRDFDIRERSRLVHQERLREEASELDKASSGRESRVAELESAFQELQIREQALKTRVEQGASQQNLHGEALRQKRREVGEADQAVAGLKARLDVLRAQEAEKQDFPSGARALLGKSEIAGLDRSRILGALAKLLRTDKKTQPALESALRGWIDAVVVRDASGLCDVLDALQGAKAGAARVLAADGISSPEPAQGPGVPLASRVKCADDIRPLVDRLFHGIFLVDDLRSAGLPAAGQVFVTPAGHLLRGEGALEVYATDQDLGNPLALQARITETETLLAEQAERAAQLRAELEAAQGEESRMQERLRAAREELQAVNREAAGREAELRTARRDLEQGSTRLSQLRNQLKDLDAKHQASDAERRSFSEQAEAARVELETLRATIESDAKAFDAAEAVRNEAVRTATEFRIRFAEHRQKVELLERQQHSLRERIRELETTIRERSEGVSTYEERVLKLDADLQAAQARIAPLEEKLAARNSDIEKARNERQVRQDSLQTLERELRALRATLEQRTTELGGLEVDIAQRRVRYENLIQRGTETYHITLPEIQQSPEPAWENGEPPSWEELDRSVETMKQKLEEMGPVNMVAIEEYQEQEDRHQFLLTQQEDLVKSKEQLLDTIRAINATTTEMFNETFQKVNANFQDMFKRLFGGGEARLELVDAGNILESGIDIVARPPGKKPQVISLLSGGERTMTAVALLFALYQVKPSPFCVLDELDAALDDANIGRFVGVVQDFLRESQFIVITHNQKTIAAADVLYGVTQERKGVSKVVSVKLTDHDKDPEDVARSKQIPAEA